jgi:hypothetical protein
MHLYLKASFKTSRPSKNRYNVGVSDPYPGQVGASYPKSIF